MNQRGTDNYEGKGNYDQNPRILVAPLDWGLGHTTRCFPIITELLSQNCHIWVAVNATQKALFEQQFPTLNFLHLQGYEILYGRTRLGLLLKILFQIPRIKRRIKDENKWLEKEIETHNFNAVISDNRYGFYHSEIPCVFITHQLTIKSPLGKWSEQFLKKWNYRFIDQFTECWVPDVEDQGNLAGVLSHPDKKPAVPLRYIGWLSRFEKLPIVTSKNNLLVLLSGPEPQRSILENKIIEELKNYNGLVTLVRGLPTASSFIPSMGNITFYNHLPSEELNKVIHESEFVISRCGYSTVMELILLKKKSILIPTPGQTEQEYLAKHLSRNQVAFCTSQNHFSLKSALDAAMNFDYKFPERKQTSPLNDVIQNFISLLLSHKEIHGTKFMTTK
jgi:UDP-N-acetylglucosamine transferase subunit ALG13